LGIENTAGKGQGDPSEIGPIDISRGREMREKEKVTLSVGGWRQSGMTRRRGETEKRRRRQQAGGSEQIAVKDI